MLLTDSDNLNVVDQERLYLIYEEWPKYFKDAANISSSCKLDREPDFYESIVFCGMGGSGTSCDILRDIIHTFSTLPSSVVRGQNMPYALNKHSLVIINSVSGNTKEAISNMEEATARKAEVICISSGGKLKDEANSNGHKHISIPNLALPRASLPYLVMPGLRLINPLLKDSIEEETLLIHSNLSRIFNNISATVPYESNIAKKIAGFLHNSSLAFSFTSPYLVSVGTRFKNSLNENAKVHCLRESILEASHNEIVPFTFNDSNSPYKALLHRWAEDRPLVKERFDNVKAFFNEIGQPLIEIITTEKSLINAIISSIYILDYATIYMAVTRNVDPSPTPAIDILKKM
jgi:glucose/mannose-6-phosphate isomerase